MSRFFVWRALSGWKRGDVPARAAVAVGIAQHHQLPNGEKVISGHLMTDEEVDYEIDRLIAELEKLRGEAKRSIRADNAKTLDAS